MHLDDDSRLNPPQRPPNVFGFDRHLVLVLLVIPLLLHWSVTLRGGEGHDRKHESRRRHSRRPRAAAKCSRRQRLPASPRACTSAARPRGSSPPSSKNKTKLRRQDDYVLEEHRITARTAEGGCLRPCLQSSLFALLNQYPTTSAWWPTAFFAQTNESSPSLHTDGRSIAWA